MSEEPRYRINPEKPKIVEGWHKDEWIDAYYCTSDESARKCLARCLERQIEWDAMTEEERMACFLR